MSAVEIVLTNSPRISDMLPSAHASTVAKGGLNGAKITAEHAITKFQAGVALSLAVFCIFGRRQCAKWTDGLADPELNRHLHGFGFIARSNQF